MRKKKSVLVGLLASMIVTTDVSAYYYTGAVHSINNEVVNADYKLDDETTGEIKKYLDASFASGIEADESALYSVEEPERSIVNAKSNGSYNEDSNRSMQDETVAAKSYLVYNNLLERKATVGCTDRGGVVTQLEDADAEGEKVFEQYNSYKSDIPDSKKMALQQLTEYSGLLQSALVKSDYVDSGVIPDSELKSIKSKLNQIVKRFSKAATDTNYKEVYKTQLKQLYQYGKSKSPNLRISDVAATKKSDFLMLLAKSAYGIKRSRPVVYSSKYSYRTAKRHSKTTSDYWNGVAYSGEVPDYWDDYQNEIVGDAYFSGDKFYWVSSNVVELYLTELLNRGVIYVEEFGDSSAAQQFLNYYNDKIENSPWYFGNGLATWGSNVFGSTLKYSSSEKVYVPKSATYFSSEGLSKMSVYEYIEDVMRQTDKNLSKMESDIVMYKIGLKYLQGYSGKQLETLKYLTAKGILNFENYEEYTGLDEVATNDFVYRMLYRYKNESARFDFSEIQLTDAESYWKDKGFAEEDIGIQELKDNFLIDDEGAEENSDDSDSEMASTGYRAGGIRDLVTKEIDSVTAASGQQYKVSFNLSKEVDWVYNNSKVADLASGQQSLSNVTVSTKNVSIGGKKVSAYHVVVEVRADSAEGANLKALGPLQCPPGSRDTVNTVTKISGTNGASNYTMIAQSALKQAFSEISVLEDKVLLNTRTGTTATLLPDNNYALIGNTVIHSSDTIMSKKEDTVEPYYSLSIIVSLLDNAFLKKIGLEKGVYFVSDKLNESKAGIQNEYGDTGMRAHCGCIKLTESMAKQLEESNKGDAEYYYRVNDISQGLNTTVYKTSAKTNGKKFTFYLVIDWDFAIPELGKFESNSKENKKLKSNSTLTNEELTEYLYTRPEDPVLRAWWDSNMVASNALANMIYGQSGVEFITSGWVVPNIKILYSKKAGVKKSAMDPWIGELFKKMTFYSFDGKTRGKEEDAKFFGNGYPNQWYLSYYDGTACYSWLEDKGELTQEQLEMLEQLTASYRGMDLIEGQATKKYDGTWFHGDFFLTQGGVLYRNLDSDSKTNYTLTKNKKSKKKEVNQIILETRSQSYVEPEVNETIVAVNNGGRLQTDKLMLYKGTETINQTEYYKLSPISNFAVNDPKDALFNAGYVQYHSNNGNRVNKIEHGGTNYLKSSRTMKNYATNAAMFVRQTDRVDNLRNQTTEEDITYGWKQIYDNWFRVYLKSDAPEIAEASKYCLQYDSDTASVAMKNGVKSLKDEHATYYQRAKIGNSSRVAYASKKEAMKCVHSVHGYKSMDYSSVSKMTDPNWAYKDDVSSKVKKISPLARIDADPLPEWEEDTKNGSIHQSMPDDYRASVMVNNIGDFAINSECATYAIPMFFIPKDQYQFATTSSESTNLTKPIMELVVADATTAISYGNYYYTSVTKAIQEAIMAHYVGTKQINELNKNCQVSIGAVRFYVDKAGTGSEKSIWLTSVVMKKTSKRIGVKNLLKYAARWSSSKKAQVAFKSEAEKIFSGMTITSDNKRVPFVQYVEGSGANKAFRPGEFKNSRMVDKLGLVYVKNDKPYGYKKGKKKRITKDNTSAYQLVRVRMKVDGTLRVRPLDNDGYAWTLAPIVNAGNLGFGGNSLSFFNESLSYEDNQYPDLGLSSSRFNPSAAFSSAKERFQNAWKRAKAGDLKMLLLSWIIIIAMYLCIISWMCFLILHYGVFRMFLEAIATGPGKSTRSGIDIIKFMSLGLYSLDSDPPIWRIVAIQFGCAIVVVAAYNIM